MGDVEVVDPSILHRLLAEGIIPVVATIAGDTKGQSYNINADAVAGAIAAALHAEKLVCLTDVTGLRARTPTIRSSRLQPGLGRRARRHGGVGRGVVGDDPQGRGVRPGRARPGCRGPTSSTAGCPHALLLEVFSDGGVGTMIFREGEVLT